MAVGIARHYADVGGISCEVDAVPDGIVVYVAERAQAFDLTRKIAARLRVGGTKVEVSHAPQLDPEQPASSQWWFACFFDWSKIL